MDLRTVCAPNTCKKASLCEGHSFLGTPRFPRRHTASNCATLLGHDGTGVLGAEPCPPSGDAPGNAVEHGAPAARVAATPHDASSEAQGEDTVGKSPQSRLSACCRPMRGHFSVLSPYTLPSLQAQKSPQIPADLRAHSSLSPSCPQGAFDKR
jgi:hypothetical protein